MDFLIVGALLYLLYQGGVLTPLGFAPSSGLLQSPQQALANQISQEEQTAFSGTNNQPQVPSELASGFSNVTNGISTGFSSGGYIGAAAGAVQGVLQTIFGGMKIRAQQATLENQALNYAVRAFDQALGQINTAYNNRSIGPQDAIALLQQAWQGYWGVMSAKIQPNRNGCANGSSCPAYVKDGYIACGPAQGGSITIGATCCVGCGPIRKALDDSISALQQGGGRVQVLAIGGDKYGLQTRFGYQITWGHA